MTESKLTSVVHDVHVERYTHANTVAQKEKTIESFYSSLGVMILSSNSLLMDNLQVLLDFFVNLLEVFFFTF